MTQYILGQIGENGKFRTIEVEEGKAHNTREVEEADIKIATIIHDGKAYGTSVNEITAQVLEVHHHELQKAREEKEGLLKAIYDYNQKALEFWHKDALDNPYSNGRMWQAKEMQQYMLGVVPMLKDYPDIDQNKK